MQREVPGPSITLAVGSVNYVSQVNGGNKSPRQFPRVEASLEAPPFSTEP